MSANSSSSSNTTLHPSSTSSTTNIYSFLHHCINSTAGSINMTAFTVTSFVFLLPFYFIVLYLGLQRWRQHRSTTTMSHSDIFTYNMVVIEMMSVLGSTFTCLGVHSDLPEMMMVGIYLFSINLSGQMYFHILTCVERYLAVVHPVTYLSLRKAKGIEIRNLMICSVWLLCLAGTGFLSVENQVVVDVFSYVVMTVLLSVICFCSLSVLYVLIRPGPGEGGGGKQHVDQSKVRAFYTIMTILGVLVFRCGGALLTTALYDSSDLGENDRCGVWMSAVWFCVPSSLVLPLLFLQRAGKLLCCKNNNEQRPD